MIIEGHDINFPGEFILRTVIDSDWKISSIIEAAELRWWDRSSVSSTCFWFGSLSLFFWSEKRGSVTSKTSSLFESVTYQSK